MSPTPIPCIQDAKGLARRSGRAFALRVEPLRVSSVPASIPRDDDLIALIERRMKLVDGLNEALAARRASRPHGQQIYRDRANRQHAKRMAAATAFKGEAR